MLCLTRKAGQKIYIGSNKEIAITVLKVSRGNVLIGIDAPKSIDIMRDDIIDKKKNRGRK